MKSKLVLLASLTAFAMGAAHAADADKHYSKEELKSDVKAAGKGIKDAAVGVGTQVGAGTKKAYRSAKSKVKKDVNERKPGDGTLAKHNDSQPTATKGHQ